MRFSLGKGQGREGQGRARQESENTAVNARGGKKEVDVALGEKSARHNPKIEEET